MSENSSKNKVVMRRVYEEMWNAKNPSVATQLFARPQGVEKFVREFLASFADLQHTIEDMIEEGNQVVVRFSARGMHTGEWMQFKPSHKPIHYTGVTVARLENGKITEHQTWWDKASLMEQVVEI